jgi:predicted Zn finger-like uncharacterized protein
MAVLGVIGLLGNLVFFVVLAYDHYRSRSLWTWWHADAGVLLAGLSGGVAAVAGLRMYQGRSWGLALLGSVAVGVTTHVCGVGTLVGLWCLIVLLAIGSEAFRPKDLSPDEAEDERLLQAIRCPECHTTFRANFSGIRPGTKVKGKCPKCRWVITFPVPPPPF